MRLLNARTFHLEDVWSVDEIKYAILSHRWEDDEVSFQDIQSPIRHDKKGFLKIRRTCEQAINDGYDYVWVDTCCIDKSSSAELTEAINSMYQWYAAASVCYAFLCDVNASARPSEAGALAGSVWFTRGWTLQELIAPSQVMFYDRDWALLGTKGSLSSVLSHITGIDENILSGGLISQCSIAQRMSWAAGRATTRVEDMAYCLLGIFDVNMPMLYGEGTKAFLRLQEEIIKTSDDHSIFAWPKTDSNQPGLLASHPAAFRSCRRVRAVKSRKGRSPYSMTNRGLSIRLQATPWSVDTYLVALDCVDELLHDSEKPIDGYRMGMFLRRLDEDDQYCRVTHDNDTFVQVESSVWEQAAARDDKRRRPTHYVELNVRQKHTPESVEATKGWVNGFRICTPALFEVGKDGKDKYSVSCESWNVESKTMSTRPGRFGTIGHIDISPQNRKLKVIKLGFDFDYNPVCFIAESGGLGEKVRVFDRNGQFEMGLDRQQAQWTAEERAQFPGIHARSCFDELGWSIVRGNTALALTQHSGLWALKGDRIHGLALRLADSETISIKRGHYQDRLVWEVTLDSIRDNMVRSILPNMQRKKSSENGLKSEEEVRKKSAFKLFK